MRQTTGTLFALMLAAALSVALVLSPASPGLSPDAGGSAVSGVELAEVPAGHGHEASDHEPGAGDLLTRPIPGDRASTPSGRPLESGILAGTGAFDLDRPPRG